MKKTQDFVLLISLLALVFTVIAGCTSSKRHTQSSGKPAYTQKNLKDFSPIDAAKDRKASDDPVIIDVEIPDPSDDPPLAVPSAPQLQGEYVTFYTWQSDGSFVTKQEVLAGFEGFTPPWDPQMLTFDEFISEYGPCIPLTENTFFGGMTLYDPYTLDVDELNVDEELAALILPGMTEEEAFETMKNYVRAGQDGSKSTSSLERGTSRISTYDPPTYNIHMDIADWVVMAADPWAWWMDYFTGDYFTHSALVVYPGDEHTDQNGPKPYRFANGHRDFRSQYGVIDLWDATVYEAIGPWWDTKYHVGHYFYSRAFISPGRQGIQEISYNYSPEVWDDPNWVSILVGTWTYAWSQNDCRWDFPTYKYDFSQPWWLGQKPTYCSMLIWQSYYESTDNNASWAWVRQLDTDWNGGYTVLPGELINATDCREWQYWIR